MQLRIISTNILAFYNFLCICFYFFLYIILSDCIVSFYFTYKIPQSIFLQGKYSGNEPLKLLLIWMSQYFPYFWIEKKSFAGYIIFGRQIFFSFRTLNMSACCLLTSKAFNEKFVFSLIENSLYVMNCCFPYAFEIFSFKSLILICLGVGLFEFIIVGIC